MSTEQTKELFGIMANSDTVNVVYNIGEVRSIALVLGLSMNEKQHHAELIKQAFNVHNKSGLTPQQLLDENLNLHEQIKQLTSKIY